MDYQQTYNRNWEPVNVRNAYDMAKCALDAIEELQKSPNSKYFTDDYIRYQAIFGKKTQGANVSFIGGGSGNNVLSIGTLNKDSDSVIISSNNSLNVNGTSVIVNNIVTVTSGGLVTFTGTWANYQATFGQTNQGGRIRLLRGDTGATAIRIGVTSATAPDVEIAAFNNLNITTSYALYLAAGGGNVQLLNGSTSGYTEIGAYGPSGYLKFRTGNTDRVRIHSTGNVVIDPTGSLTDAGFTLDVNGPSRFQNRVRLAIDTTYADNAAAISGGLATGTIYTTPTGELRKVI